MILCKLGIHKYFYPQLDEYPIEARLFFNWDEIRHRCCRRCGKKQWKNIYYAFHSKIEEWDNNYDIFWWMDYERKEGKELYESKQDTYMHK